MTVTNKEWQVHFLNLLKEGAFDDGIKYKRSFLPKSLFKYQSFDDPYALNNILNEIIYLSNPGDFNDAFDCTFDLTNPERTLNQLVFNDTPENQHRFTRLDELSNCLIDENSDLFPNVNIRNVIDKVWQKQLDKLICDFNNSTRNYHYRVFCLSEVSDSNKMWGLYAQKHAGFCIEYGIDEHIWDGLFARLLFPVIYQSNPFDISPYLLSEDLKVRINGFLLLATHKSIDWEYEREWRFVFSSGLWEGKPLTYIAPPIKSIILGERMSSVNQERLKKIANIKNIPLSKAKMDIRKRKIVIEGIDC